MARLSFSEQAEDDLLDIFHRGLLTRSPAAALAFADEIRARCPLMADNPNVGRYVSGRRRTKAHTFDRLVTVLFQVSDDEVVVLRALPRGADVQRAARKLRP